MIIDGNKKSPGLGPSDLQKLQLPEADYGAEVKAMQAVINQIRNLTGNLEGLLFNLMVYSHKIPDRPKPDPIVVMEDGDVVEREIPRLVRGSLTGICPTVEGTEDVRAPTNEQETTATSS